MSTLLRSLALGLLALLVVVLGGCGGGDDKASIGTQPAPAEQGPPIRIGAKNFTEQAILGELYRQALEAKGYDVVLKADVGSTEIIHRALRREVLDMYPEYVGILVSEVAEQRAPRSASAAYDVAKAFEKRGGYTLLAPTPFEDANALAVKPAFATRHKLKTIADLARLKGIVQIGALPEFRTRFEGLDGLQEIYGLRHLRVTPVDSDERYDVLENGDVDITLVFTTEGQLAGNTYVVLEDPRGLFASGHVAPIISDKVLAAHGPGLQAAIDAVSKLLTTPAMREMNAAVDLAKRKPADVAGAFLRKQGLG